MAEEKAEKTKEKGKSKDESKSKDDSKSKDEAKPKDNGKSADESKSKDESKKDESDSSSAKPAAPGLGTKAMRAFLFTSLATFLTGLLFADPIPTGLRVHFDLPASIKLGLIAGVIAALLRALAAMLPVFADDTSGRQKS